jgi:DNA-binding transcriptional ArsR family regulator
MEVMLKPVTDIAENALGLIGGDWLTEKRARNRSRLKQKTEEILRSRSATLDTDPSPTVVIPLLTAAQDEGREELLSLWAALLAAGSDPTRRDRYRREFVGIAKRLEPVDAVVLKSLGKQGGRLQPDQGQHFAHEHGLSDDQLEIALDKLQDLGLVNANSRKMSGSVVMTSLAREMCFAISD